MRSCSIEYVIVATKLVCPSFLGSCVLGDDVRNSDWWVLSSHLTNLKRTVLNVWYWTKPTRGTILWLTIVDTLMQRTFGLHRSKLFDQLSDY
jgi:hypothetical protein